ncbi:MAG: hypothetical protein EP312_06060 [Gammaproteobacteria bacterium]|nr:MAG: hypothetical protein EP312_06060 [Gammaproteobacteria bacterium]
MRYSILAGWLLLLALPFTPIPRGSPAISPLEVIGAPIRYLRAFDQTYRPLFKGLQTPKALPSLATPGDVTVKSWRDEKGVMHFSDTGNAPAHAEEKVVKHIDNSQLMSQPPVLTSSSSLQQVTLLGMLLLATAILMAALHGMLVIGLRTVTWIRDRQAGNDDDTEPAPAPLAAFEFHGNTSSDPYAILGISPKASNHNVRSAYEKALARYSAEQLLGMSPGQQEAARMKARDIEDAWQRIRIERSMG